MSIGLETIFIGALSIMVATIAWFIKRDIARFENVLEKHAEGLSRNSESLASMMHQVNSALEVAKWNPQLQRFFGDDGGHARLWRAIEDLNGQLDMSRRRHHWFANKLAVVKGSMEVAGLKCGDPAGWVMPDWEAKK